MLPRISQGMFRQINTLKTCPLYQVQQIAKGRSTTLTTSIDTMCRQIRSHERLIYPVAIFEPDVRTKESSKLLRIITESYQQLRQRHGAVFLMTLYPNLDDVARDKKQLEQMLSLPFPVFHLRRPGLIDLTSMGIIKHDQRHLFLLTPRGEVLKEKSCAIDEELVSDSADLMRWTAAHGSHAPDANEIVFYRRQ